MRSWWEGGLAAPRPAVRALGMWENTAFSQTCINTPLITQLSPNMHGRLRPHEFHGCPACLLDKPGLRHLASTAAFLATNSSHRLLVVLCPSPGLSRKGAQGSMTMAVAAGQVSSSGGKGWQGNSKSRGSPRQTLSRLVIVLRSPAYRLSVTPFDLPSPLLPHRFYKSLLQTSHSPDVIYQSQDHSPYTCVDLLGPQNEVRQTGWGGSSNRNLLSYHSGIKIPDLRCLSPGCSLLGYLLGTFLCG